MVGLLEVNRYLNTTLGVMLLGGVIIHQLPHINIVELKGLKCVLGGNTALKIF